MLEKEDLLIQLKPLNGSFSKSRVGGLGLLFPFKVPFSKINK